MAKKNERLHRVLLAGKSRQATRLTTYERLTLEDKQLCDDAVSAYLEEPGTYSVKSLSEALKTEGVKLTVNILRGLIDERRKQANS